MKQILVVGLVVLLVIAGLVVIVASSSQGSDEIGGELSVFIEDVETGEIHTGSVSINSLTFGEMAMLNFGQNIRTASIQPLFTYETKEPLDPDGKYNIWTCVRVKVTAEHIAEVTKNEVVFTGNAVAPTHSVLRWSSTTMHGTDQVVVNDKVILNDEVTIDQYTETNKKWTYKQPTGGTVSEIRGANINGMELHASVNLVVVGEDGKTHDISKSATLTISVKNWDEPIESSISIAITGMGPGSEAKAITIIPMAVIGLCAIGAVGLSGKE